jgi:hypothetical protein
MCFCRLRPDLYVVIQTMHDLTKHSLCLKPFTSDLPKQLFGQHCSFQRLAACCNWPGAGGRVRERSFWGMSKIRWDIDKLHVHPFRR